MAKAKFESTIPLEIVTFVNFVSTVPSAHTQ